MEDNGLLPGLMKLVGEGGSLKKLVMFQNLPFDLERDHGIEEDEPTEAWTLDQPYWIKFGLVSKLVVVGEFLIFTLI